MFVRPPIALLAAGSVLLAGCSGSTAGKATEPGSIRPIPALRTATLRVGSNESNEQILLGKIAIDVLRAAGAGKVVDKTNIQGATGVRDALTGDQIDLDWDYTGTVWSTYLRRSDSAALVTDSEQLFQAVQKADAVNHVAWVDPAPASDTYAFATKDQLSVATISQYAALAERDPGSATLCVDSEFRNRNLPGVQRKYHFRLSARALRPMQTTAVYSAIGKTCNFGVVLSTDGQIRAKHLVVLQDDKNYFPKYNIVLGLRQDVLQKYPQLEKLFAPVAAKLTDSAMVQLNYQVTTQGLDPGTVARKWLQQERFLSS
jgi:osmoprotectant transport system substrate-binding protein